MLNKKRFVRLRRLHGKIHDSVEEKKELYKLIRKIKTVADDAFILTLTPTHGNLGDHAIAMAEIELFQKHDICYTEVNNIQLSLLKKHNKLSAFNRKKIMLSGGGNLGSLWPEVETVVRSIIQQCPKSKILFLPNTVYYDSDSELKFEDSVKIYNSNHNVIICTREKTSYDFVVNHYNNVRLIPDMVLSMHPEYNNLKRNGCLICLRNDKEKTMDDNTYEQIVHNVKKVFDKRITYTDMVLNHTVMPNERKKELDKKIEEFLKAEIVITDRLHGMIFAAITGTPCIVFNSKSPKVKGCYEWIQNLEYIKFLDDPNKIEIIYNRLKGKTYFYNNDHLQHYYDELINIIKEMRDS